MSTKTLILLMSFIATFEVASVVMSCGAFIEKPGAAEGREIEDHAAKLLKCREEGRDAGSYKAYEDCKKDAGL